MKKKHPIKFVAFASVSGLFGLLNSAHAQLTLGDTIGIDFGSIAPTATANFNQFDAFNNNIDDDASAFIGIGTPSVPGATVLDGGAGIALITTGNSTVTNVTLTVTNNSGQNTSRADVTNGSTGPAPFDDATIFSDSILSNDQPNTAELDDGANLVLTFSGLDDSLNYELTGGLDGANANFDSTWDVDGQSFLSAPGADTGYQTLSNLSTDGSGNLVITVTVNTFHVNVGALTLTATLPPADSDNDLIDDEFELMFAGNLTDLDGTVSGPGPGAGTGDFDNDGLTDLEEFNLRFTFVGLDPTNADSDGDGISDGDEVDQGSDPADSDSPNGGYAASGSDWLSADAFGAFDINGNGLGDDGFIFFGAFDGIGDGGEAFTENVTQLPTYVSSIDPGSDAGGVDGSASVVSGFAGYGEIDDPNLLDGTNQIAGFVNTGNISNTAQAGDIFEILTFDVVATGNTIRVGVLGGIERSANGAWDPTAITLSGPNGFSVTEDNNGAGLAADPDGVNAGWVFFDITEGGTYTVIATYRGGAGGRGTGIGGLTFDSDSSGLTLCVESDPNDSNSLAFEWESQAGFEYSLVSNTDLSIPVSSWDVYNDGSTTFENIAASGTGTNTLTGVARVGQVRFFALQEIAILPTVLFSSDFDTDNGGFTTVNKGTGSVWEWGIPNGSGLGGAIVSANSAPNCWGVELNGFYAAGTNACLRSPVIDLTNVTISGNLTFAENLDVQNSNTTVEVWVIDDTTDAEIGTEPVYVSSDPDEDSTGWAPSPIISLPSEALGQPIRLEWRQNGDSSSNDFLGWYIDDVEVSGL